MRNSAVLPFSISDCMRILAFAVWWSGLFPIVCVMLILYYPFAVFVARTNLLGRIEPGPPTKPLQYRVAFHVYLPFHLLLHLLLTFGIYSDVELETSMAEPRTQCRQTPARSVHRAPLKPLAVVCLLQVDGFPLSLWGGLPRHTRCSDPSASRAQCTHH